VTWHCRACGQVGRVLQVANLRPDPVPAPVLEPEPEPEPESARDLLTRVTSGAGPPETEPPAVGLLESLRSWSDAWTGEDSTDRAAAAAGVPPDLLESIDSAADQVARETRAPRKGDR